MAETFGKTDIGGTVWSNTGNRIHTCRYESGSAGTLASISVYVEELAVGTKIKCAIYDAASPANLLANGETEEKTIVGDGWITLNFAIPPEVAATTDYRLVFWQDGDGTTYYDAGAVNQTTRTDVAYGAWPNPLALSFFYNLEISIYATYIVENQAPTTPTGQQVDDQSSPIGANCISDLTPEFSAIFEDPDAGDLSNAIQIQVGTASGLSDMWDSGWLADATIEGNECSAKTYAGAVLSTGTSYWWRCRFRDDDNLVGAWSAWQQFDICEEGLPGGPGLQCVPGGSLPRRGPFTCATQMPREEPGYHFPFEFPIPQSPCN